MKTFSLYRSSKSLLSFLLVSVLGFGGMGKLHATHEAWQIDKAEEIESIGSESQSEVQEGIEAEEKFLSQDFELFQAEPNRYFIEGRRANLDLHPLIGIDPPPEQR